MLATNAVANAGPTPGIASSRLLVAFDRCQAMMRRSRAQPRADERVSQRQIGQARNDQRNGNSRRLAKDSRRQVIQEGALRRRDPETRFSRANALNASGNTCQPAADNARPIDAQLICSRSARWDANLLQPTLNKVPNCSNIGSN
jgi:hypothetical protein